MQDSSFLGKKMHFACTVSCTLLPVLLSFQNGLTFFYCQPTAGKVLFLLAWCESWQSCWFSFYANIYPDVQCEVAAGVCSLWFRLLPFPSDSVKDPLHADMVCVCVCPCTAPEQSPAGTHVCTRNLSAHVSQCLTLHWNGLKSCTRSSRPLCRIGNVQDRRDLILLLSFGIPWDLWRLGKLGKGKP